MQIANTFSPFFCDIPNQIEKVIIQTQKAYDELLTNSLEQSFECNWPLTKKKLSTSES